MKRENADKNLKQLDVQLKAWMRKVEDDEVDEMLNFMPVAERNSLEIPNYFRFGATNAITENINGKIQRSIPAIREQETDSSSTSDVKNTFLLAYQNKITPI
jgi:hypothetical protein